MEDKKVRLDKMREMLRKISTEVDTSGIVFFAAVCPNDETPEDIDTPAFYLAYGDQAQIAGLLGNTLGDMMLKVESDANTGPDVHYRTFFLEALILSAQRVLGGESYPGFSKGTSDEDKTAAEAEEDALLEKKAGLQFYKKGGSA
jgi:hypothetical protein